MIKVQRLQTVSTSSFGVRQKGPGHPRVLRSSITRGGSWMVTRRHVFADGDDVDAGAEREAGADSMLADLYTGVKRMAEKYDFLSACMGSLCVTGYFTMVHGQDVGTALSITFSSTVMAVVLNEFFLSE